MRRFARFGTICTILKTRRTPIEEFKGNFRKYKIKNGISRVVDVSYFLNDSEHENFEVCNVYFIKFIYKILMSI